MQGGRGCRLLTKTEQRHERRLAHAVRTWSADGARQPRPMPGPRSLCRHRSRVASSPSTLLTTAVNNRASRARSDKSRNIQEVRSMTRKCACPKLPGALHECLPWERLGIEPQLCEVLADPLVHAVMQCDGVSPATLDSVIAHAKWRLRQCTGPG